MKNTQATPSSAEVAPAINTVEHWATAKGYLPEMRTVPSAALPGRGGIGVISGGLLRSVEHPQNPEYWRFAAAKAYHRWPEGRLITEADFDAAVKVAIS